MAVVAQSKHRDNCSGMPQVHQQQLGDAGGKHVEQVAGAARTVLRPTAQEEFEESRGSGTGGHTQPSGGW